MKGKIEVFCLIASLSAAGAFVPPAAAQSNVLAATTSAPVAYVYVSRPTHIDGFAASSKGKLTPVPGSPPAIASVVKLSVTKKYLFGENNAGSAITTFSIASTGAIKKVSSFDPQPYAPSGSCVYYPDIRADGIGTTLYDQVNPECPTGAQPAYISLHIESNGHLQYLGNSGGYFDNATQGVTEQLTVMGGDKFAFDAYCGEDENNLPVIDIYRRNSTGLLSYIGQDNDTPADTSGSPYCFGRVAADAANHLAVAVQRIDSQVPDDGFIFGPYFLATYTADSDGHLTTTSTTANMPETTVTNKYLVNAMSISPGDKYLAVGGPKGLQIFHFNGSKPITKYSSALQPNVEITRLGWDKAGHVYALGGGNLYVYTVTSSGIKQASGSPHSVPESSDVVVLDLQ